MTKTEAHFRDYSSTTSKVAKLYEQNHRLQTLAHVLSVKEAMAQRAGKLHTIWEVLNLLDSLVDESDPDTEHSQTVHALQSAEAARRDGQPRWMQLACLIHDLGKILCLYGYEQWTVVGDTFPVGCAFSPKIVHAQYFSQNPDTADPVLSTKYGIYKPNCGFMNVHMSYGHDEFIYQVVKDFLPFEASYVLRFHSFYPWHRDGQYEFLMDDTDKKMKELVLAFNQYDLYSKAEEVVDINVVKDYYQGLIDEFFGKDRRVLF
ncbi:hypothetical protein HDU83_000036 [Entophlyctis luteolus]|nr:hypothetical protein HDU83_000036 [Entophlyctis luteolus]KAJ3395253.1 hypothetical protein HDU84_000020 [Entophlyctis sp. JEL0112]